MRWRKAHVVGLVLLLVALLSGVLAAQSTPAAYALTITPEKPTTRDTVTLKLAGPWSDNCPPEKLKVTLEGNRINVDMLLPGAEGGKVAECKAIKTNRQLTATVGPLTAGACKVYVRGVSATVTGGYAKLGEFEVRASTTGPTRPMRPPEPKTSCPGSA